jgi:hypothetical protein
MKKKTLIQKLAERGIVGKWPPRWVPFFLAGIFFVFALIAEKQGLSWNGRLNIIGWITIGWGIVHWYIVREIK